MWRETTEPPLIPVTEPLAKCSEKVIEKARGNVEPGHVVRRAGRVVSSGDACVHAVRALQAEGVVRLFPRRGRCVVQDGVVHDWPGG